MCVWNEKLWITYLFNQPVETDPSLPEVQSEVHISTLSIQEKSDVDQNIRCSTNSDLINLKTNGAYGHLKINEAYGVTTGGQEEEDTYYLSNWSEGPTTEQYHNYDYVYDVI